MNNVVVRNAFQNKETVLENHLLPAYIQVGNLILLNTTDNLIDRWTSCAIITHADHENEIFKIKLLFPTPVDGLGLITTDEDFYQFLIHTRSGNARLSMRPVTPENAAEVAAFLTERHKQLRKVLDDKYQEYLDLGVMLQDIQSSVKKLTE